MTLSTSVSVSVRLSRCLWGAASGSTVRATCALNVDVNIKKNK